MRICPLSVGTLCLGCLAWGLLLSPLHASSALTSYGQSCGSPWLLTVSLSFLPSSMWSLPYIQLWRVCSASFGSFFWVFNADVVVIQVYPWDEMNLGSSYSAIFSRSHKCSLIFLCTSPITYMPNKNRYKKNTHTHRVFLAHGWIVTVDVTMTHTRHVHLHFRDI